MINKYSISKKFGYSILNCTDVFSLFNLYRKLNIDDEISTK